MNGGPTSPTMPQDSICTISCAMLVLPDLLLVRPTVSTGTSDTDNAWDPVSFARHAVANVHVTDAQVSGVTFTKTAENMHVRRCNTADRSYSIRAPLH